jgi:hypothetical protein
VPEGDESNRRLASQGQEEAGVMLGDDLPLAEAMMCPFLEVQRPHLGGAPRRKRSSMMGPPITPRCVPRSRSDHCELLGVG